MENFVIAMLINNLKLILTIVTIITLYIYYTATFDFFKKKGIYFIKPVIFFGNLGPRVAATKSYHDFDLEMYNKFKGIRYGGIFEGRKPLLFIIDPELVKAIMIRDADHFTDRHEMMRSTNPRYISRSVLNLKGRQWKDIRSIITPVFSSSRLKNMLPLLRLCTEQMVGYLRKYDGSDVEMKSAMGHYTLEVIGACAFGIKCDALTEGKSDFIKIAEQFDYISKTKWFIINLIWFLAPALFKIKTLSNNLEATDKLVQILQAVKAERRLGPSDKKDFLQLLIDIAKEEKEFGKALENELDDETIDAQCLLFLIAGYETSSTLLSFALHVLATAPHLQRRLREHVTDVTQGKDMSYELLAELTYLDAFLLETLRMYSPICRVNRVVTKPYQIPDSSVRLSVGDVVVIPVYGIHMDPAHYPDPTVFRPERFMGDEKKNRPAHLFLPFGAGPRNCIGMRFAMMSTKIAMVALLKNFSFSPGPKTVHSVKFINKIPFLKTESGLWVRIETLKD